MSRRNMRYCVSYIILNKIQPDLAARICLNMKYSAYEVRC